jgi:hypothetical protein
MSYEKYQNVGMAKERYNENSGFHQQQQQQQQKKPMKVTFIDDLPELEDVEQQAPRISMQNSNPQIDDKFKKYIRSDSIPHENSGMVAPQQQYHNQQHMMQENHHVNPIHLNHRYQIPSSDDGNLQHYMQRDQQPLKLQLSCVDIAEHVQNCPVCGKLYKNDNTMYMGIIAILVILCILLIKRVLEVPVEK